jgi:DNA-binding transcriptional LysR family regulator
MKSIPQAGHALNSQQLYTLATLVRTGSFTEAARNLCLTLPAISHSIHALESEVGCRLLTRMGKSVSPTGGGEALFPYAQLGLDEFAKAREMVSHLSKWGMRRFRIGANALIPGARGVHPVALNNGK